MNRALAYARSLRTSGRPMDLKRRIGTTSGYYICTVRGKPVDYQPIELLSGVIKTGDRKIRVAALDIPSTWPAPPIAGDFVIIDGKTATVQGVETLFGGTELIGYKIWVRGG